MSLELERSMFDAVSWPHPSLTDSHRDGCTEPWIAEIVCSLLKASGADFVLETGSFVGTTSAWLALTLSRMGGGILYACDIDAARAEIVQNRLDSLPLPDMDYRVINADVFEVIAAQADGDIGFVWLDDDHTKPHVRREIQALWPKMKPNGLIVGHDVFGSVDLQEVFA